MSYPHQSGRAAGPAIWMRVWNWPGLLMSRGVRGMQQVCV